MSARWISVALVGVALAACAPARPPTPTSLGAPAASPSASIAAASQCHDELQDHRFFRALVLGDLNATGEPERSTRLTMLPGHIQSGWALVGRQPSCFSPETRDAWQDAYDIVMKAAAERVGAERSVDELRVIFEAIPMEPE